MGVQSECDVSANDRTAHKSDSTNDPSHIRRQLHASESDRLQRIHRPILRKHEKIESLRLFRLLSTVAVQ